LAQENLFLEEQNADMKEQIRYKQSLEKHPAIRLSTEYGLMMNEVRMLESYSGTSMNVQLEDAKNADDIANHYESTSYKGVRGLKIKIVIDKFSKETDMGAVLDDVHILEKSTDFLASTIAKDNNNLIVKGEIYGI
jgi:hypothetical protein